MARLYKLAAMAAMTVVLTIGTVSAATAADKGNPFKGIKIKGSFTDEYGKHGKLRGTLDITSFAAENQKIVAIGEITGIMTDSKGTETGVSQVVTLPVERLKVTMEDDGSFARMSMVEIPILHLTLGPLDLDLLGLTVHLDRIVLNVDAHTGPGQLLGNLLVALLGLLDPIAFLANLAQIIDILNQILNLFG